VCLDVAILFILLILLLTKKTTNMFRNSQHLLLLKSPPHKLNTHMRSMVDTRVVWGEKAHS